MTFANFFFLLLIFIPLTLLWVFALVDLAQRKNIAGAVKALWAVAIVLLPVIGMLIYFIAVPPQGISIQIPRGEPGEASPPMITDDRIVELEKLAKLKDDGVITDDEFSDLKARVIG
jgi:hypothetical protein